MAKKPGEESKPKDGGLKTPSGGWFQPNPKEAKLEWSIGTPPKDGKTYLEGECGKCRPTSRIRYFLDILYESQEDARRTARAFGREIGAKYLPIMWKRAWEQFKCSDPNCPEKEACGDSPTLIGVGVIEGTLTPKAEDAKAKKELRWCLYVFMIRDIRCISKKQAPKDVPPVMPTPEEPEHPEEPGDAKWESSVGVDFAAALLRPSRERTPKSRSPRSAQATSSRAGNRGAASQRKRPMP